MVLGAGHTKLCSFQDGQVKLHEDCLQWIRTTKDLQIVAIMGEGRAGKSDLGNELLGHQVFATANGGDAMTQGIDVALGEKLIMDCEGLNNALAPSRPEVLLIGAALASTVIFVLDGKLSESGLDILSGLIADMQLLQKRLPTRLLLVVNKCTLDYGPERREALEKALNSTHGNRGGRDAIRRAFKVTIPFDRSKGETYRQALNELTQLVAADAVAVDGLQLSEMLLGVADQLKDSRCDLPSLHQQIMDKVLQGQVDATLHSFTQSMGPNPEEYDPEFKGDVSESLRSFEDWVQKRALTEVAAPFAEKLQIALKASLHKRRKLNEDLGDSIANWREVLRKGCQLLAKKRIGARVVVQRKQDLSPFLASAEVFRLNPPVPLSVRWMWEHFHPQHNPQTHDFAAVVTCHGQVVAVRVASPPLPPGILPPRGNARHKAALSVSLRSDAWVAVVSEERGEISVACAGELWDAGSSFPHDQDYEVQERQRRNTLMTLNLLWESRQISSSAKGRLHSLTKWVWDGHAHDGQSGLSSISKHWKSANGAKSHAEEELRNALKLQGIIWDFNVPSKL